MNAGRADYVRANDESPVQLRALVERLDPAQLTRSAMPGWSVSALLAHLAFWNRINQQRRRSKLSGTELPALDVFDDLINDASLPVWNALPPEIAARDALASAEEDDAFVAALAPEITSRLLSEADRVPSIDRSTAASTSSRSSARSDADPVGDQTSERSVIKYC